MRNVVLVCLDTLRQDYFEEFAPRLQERADTTYTQCRAVSGWSVPSHASILTGELPHVHGVHTHARDYTQIDQEGTFLSDLNDYSTLCVSANAYVSRSYGFDTFFDSFTKVSRDTFQFGGALSPKHLDLSEVGYVEYLKRSLRDSKPLRSLANGALIKFDPYDFLFSGRPWPERKDNGTRKVLEKAQSQIAAEESPEAPVFAFLNVMESHTPMYHHRDYDQDLHSVPNRWSSSNVDAGGYEVSHNTEQYERYLDYWRQLYQASIDYLDRHLNDWINDILAATYNDTTIIITSDHGQNLGIKADDYLFGHHTSLSEGILHVPLLLVNPPDGYPDVEDGLVSQLDLESLVFHLARDETFAVPAEPVPAEVIGHTGLFSGTTNLTYWDRLIRSVYHGDEKKTWDSTGAYTKYELDANKPCVQTEVQSEPGECPPEDRELFDTAIFKAKRTAVFEELASGSATPNEEVEERLADLGYM